MSGAPPWRMGEVLPETIDDAAWVMVGWILYRRTLLSDYRSELIIPGLVARK